MFIKLCGFTRTEDIEKITGLPVSSAGFIFHKRSERYVTPHRAAEMVQILKGSGISATGVFVDNDPDVIMDIVKTAGLDIVQVYNRNTAYTLSRHIPVIEGVRLGSSEDRTLPLPLSNSMVLFDTYSNEAHGGTGKSFNHNLLREYPHRDKMIIAGGLNFDNIKETIIKLRPGGVDISSGIEISRGIKCGEKILKIIQKIKEAENDIYA